MLSNLFKLFLSTALIAQPAFAQNAINSSEQFPGINYQRNFVKNPGAEKNKNNITDASTIATRSTSTPLEGAASFSIDATSSGQVVKFDTNTLDNALKGQNCEARFVYSGDATLYKAYVEQGSTKVTADLTLTYPTYSQPVSINFPCGDLSANSHLVIESTSSSAAAIKVDTVYLGLATNLGAVAQASFVGSLKYTGAANCNWSTNSTSYAAFAADTDCSTAVLVSGSGTPSAPGTKIPGVVFNNLGPGTYKVTANFAGYKGGTVDASVRFAINDGTTTGPGTNVYANTTDGAYAMPTSVVGYFTYASAQSSLTFQVYGFASSSSSNYAHILANETGIDFTISVEYFPTSSQLALNSNLPSYPTIQTFTSGSGTYTKPNGVQYIRVRMVGGGGGGAGSATFAANNGGAGGAGGTTTFGTSLLTANGGGGASGGAVGGGSGGTASLGTGPIGTVASGASGSTASNSNNVTNIVCVGGAGGSTPFGGAGGGGTSGGVSNTGGGGGGGNSPSNGVSGAGGGAGGFVDAIISTPSSTYSYSVGASGTSGAAGTSGGAGGAGGSGYIEVTEYYSAVPAPLLVGSVTSNSSGTERIERISFGSTSTTDCTSTPCGYVSRQSGSAVSSVTRNSAGAYTINWTAGMWSSAPTCTCTAHQTGVNTLYCGATINNSTSTWDIFTRTSAANTATDAFVHIICMGPR